MTLTKSPVFHIKKPILVSSLIIALFLGISSIAHAEQEILNEFNEESLPVLNENTRELFDRVYDSEGDITTNTTDITTNTTAIASLDKFPAGGIIMWSGTIATIPSGWVLCDGTNSTPDLRNRFVIGAIADADSDYDVGDTGDGTIPAHTHTQGNNQKNVYSGSGSSANMLTNTTCAIGSQVSTVTGSYGTGTTNIAIYYALAFIMKT